jgi:hypothetical protein
VATALGKHQVEVAIFPDCHLDVPIFLDAEKLRPAWPSLVRPKAARRSLLAS